ncbi:MAG: hypothetical protein M3157_00600 [Actinomycetota bacterium]|nr:hypothetical protein [Actinomycetota bacterium]
MISPGSQGLGEPGKTEDPWLRQYINLRRSMRDLTNTGEPAPEEAYDQYREWLPFTHRVDSFIRRTAEDLRYDPDELETDWRY